MNTTHPIRFVFLLAAMIAVTNSVRADGPEFSPAEENLLIAVLRSDAPGAEKAITCKKLAIVGSNNAVPELAKLLPNQKLSSWARIALEAIPGDEAAAALREASNSLDGRLLIGVINSIGVRRDAAAVESLTIRLNDTNTDVASAAAVALGRIGNEAATKSLLAALGSAPADVRSAAAEGCVLSAERLYAVGNSAVAADIYDKVRVAEVPMQRVIEATRGSILARNQEGLTLLMEIFRSSDKKLFQLALGTAREFPGSAIDTSMANELATTNPERAALIIQAMADRPDTVILEAVVKSAVGGDKQVRLSAIDALRRVGDDSCLAALIAIATDSDADLSHAAKETLAGLPGANVDEQIVKLLPTAKGNAYPLLIQLIGQRRIDAVPEVLKAMDHPDQEVRSAALVALGETVSLKRLSVLVSQVVSPQHAEDSIVAREALKKASIRMPDREACASELAKALDESPDSAKVTLLETLADVGGTNALHKLASVAKGSDPQLQDAGSRLLGKWNNVDAAPVLLDLARTAPAEKYRVRSLRGYIGIARKFAMTDQQRAEMCGAAMETSDRVAEQKLTLDVMTLHPSIEMLKLASVAKQIPALKSDANAAMLVIAQKLSEQGIDTSELLSGAGMERIKLEILKAEYGAGSTQKDVTEVVRKQAGDLPVIVLASAEYNSSFGGDPAPGIVKRLQVQYRINGKTGKATFAENSPIILPMP